MLIAGNARKLATDLAVFEGVLVLLSRSEAFCSSEMDLPASSALVLPQSLVDSDSLKTPLHVLFGQAAMLKLLALARWRISTMRWSAERF